MSEKRIGVGALLGLAAAGGAACCEPIGAFAVAVPAVLLPLAVGRDLDPDRRFMSALFGYVACLFPAFMLFMSTGLFAVSAIAGLLILLDVYCIRFRGQGDGGQDSRKSDAVVVRRPGLDGHRVVELDDWKVVDERRID